MTNGCAGFSVQGESGAELALIGITTRLGNSEKCGVPGVHGW